MPAALAETLAFLPRVYDANVAALDGTFGAQPSFVVGALFIRWPDLAWLCAAIYAGVLLPTAIVALAEGHRGRRTGLGALPTFLVIAGVGFAIYRVLPVIGPVPYSAMHSRCCRRARTFRRRAIACRHCIPPGC